MKDVIIRIRLQRLKNETHVQFNENVNSVFVKYNPQELGFPALYYPYKSAFDNETKALDFIRKSEITAKIAEQDSRRDQIYRGLVDTVKGEMNHFEPTHVQAAERLYDVFKHYGNIVQKTLDDETAAINDLVRELNLPVNAQAIQLLNLSAWLYRLTEENRLLAQYMTERYVEISERTPLRMKQTRIETDKYYHAIVGQIENQILAGAVVNPAFIRELNTVIERFKHILAQEINEHKPKKE
ncbi:MAG: DUF6261 family protein [Dysgonamonadaceae bacterium]|jgi:hypothetical protein|nr:DUF6261 family protein [Dysgonamonadaceae bacterium]